MGDDVSMPVLHLGRRRDGTFSGFVNEGGPDATGPAYVFDVGTPEEIIAQWLDRYTERPHTLALTQEERLELLDCLARELTISRRLHTEARPGGRLALLQGVLLRLEGLT